MNFQKRTLLPFLATALLQLGLRAQQLSVDIPPSLILVNYDRMSIGSREGLEAGAYVARADDAGANWYNPAGLSRSEKSAVNAAGTGYEWSHTSLEGLGETNRGSRLTTFSTYLGAVVGDPVISSDKWRLGFSITTPIAWSPGTLNPSFSIQNGSGGSGTVGYYSELSFSEIVPALSAGYASGGAFRFGLSLGGSITNLKQLQATSSRSMGSPTATFGSSSFVADGTQIALFVQGGVQVDISNDVRFGLRVVAPSARLSGSSQIAYRSSLYSGKSYQDMYLRDDEADFEYRLPVEVDAGVSVKFTDAEVEMDIRYHGNVADYLMYSFKTPWTRATVDSNGVPLYESGHVDGESYGARQIVNVAVGGNYAFNGSLSLHIGLRSDLSPVVDGRTAIFPKVDLYGGTIGLSVTWAHLSGSAGLSYSTGTSEESDVRSVTGQVIKTTLGVSTLQLLLALSYGF